MRSILFFCLLLVSIYCASLKNKSQDGWIPLFDGKSLDGWRASENPATFKIENGMILVNGPRAHLFYEGPVMNHQFKNFEIKARVMTTAGSNPGIFFHTAYQENGWPEKGYEVQVNNSHTDWRRTGSLYAVQDVRGVYVKDDEWCTEEIKVEGKKVSIKINDEVVLEYVGPEGIEKT